MKMKRFVIFLIIVLLSIGIIGCNNNAGEDDDGGIKVLMPFDTYQQVQSFRTFTNLFGRAEINTDKKYIKEGKGSLHVMPVGDYNSVNAYPCIYINCEKDYFLTRDFSDFEYIALDVYNDTDKTLTIKLHMSLYGDLEIEDTPVRTYTLTPNAWTKAVYTLDGSIRRTFGKLDTVKGIYIQFPEYKTTKDGEVNSLYLDNLVGKVSGNIEPYSPQRGIDELVYFENPSDINLFNTRCNEFDVVYNADLSINMDPAYVSQGKMSMKCEYKYVYIKYQNFTRSINPWAQVSINLAPYKHFLYNAEGISIDVFNPNDTERAVTVFYRTRERIQKEVHNIGINQWKTIELRPAAVDDINDWMMFGIMTNYEKEYADYTFYIDNIKFIR